MKKEGQELAWMYLAEQTSPEDNVAKNVNVVDKNGIFYAEFDTILQSFKVMNNNGRRYLGPNVWAMITGSRKIQSCLKHNGWFGEMNHPYSKYKDKPLSPERIRDIDMGNTSHKHMNPKLNGNLLEARIMTDAGTDAGKNMATKILQGLIPGFSARAIAGLQMLDGLPTVIMKNLICYDWVFDPSHNEAFAITTPEMKFKGFTESTADDVCTPLTELVQYAADRTENLQLIMESFGLDNADLGGFSKDKNSIFVRDKDNLIYCNMTPELSREVKGYLTNL